MITLHTFASGSEGNSLVIKTDTTAVLVDAGISTKRIVNSLASVGLLPEDLSAIFITHEHSDHIQGLTTFVKKYSVPIIASPRTAERIACKIPNSLPYLRTATPGSGFTIGDLQVQTFRTSHDAAQSMDYRFDTEDGCSVGVLTDTGYVTNEAEDTLMGCKLIVLESNHDPYMLKNGYYPYHLQQRILSDHGHLCNDIASRFAVQLAHHGTQEFILAHLSKDNNTPDLALETMCKALQSEGFDLPVSVAPRCTVSCAYTVENLE